MEVLRVSKGSTDGNGQEFISIYLEYRLDEQERLHRQWVSFLNDHRKQSCHVSLWSENPHRTPAIQMDKELGLFKGEVLVESEAVAFVQSLSL